MMLDLTISKRLIMLSSQNIAEDDDLLIEVLIRLPINSLLRFKSVSKRWLSLITDPQFCHRKNQISCKSTSGLLLNRSSSHLTPNYDFVSLLADDFGTTLPFRMLNSVEVLERIKVIQSCNGLLLCRTFQPCRSPIPIDRKYHIINPTTKKFITFPVTHLERFPDSGMVKFAQAISLAFDPRKSPHYKLVCVYFCGLSVIRGHFEIEVYSSETGLRRLIAAPFHAAVDFSSGVYWNGAINWIAHLTDGLYFKLDEERFGSLPMPPLPDGLEEDRSRMRYYFKETNDHLHLIQICSPRTLKFNVYEMDRDYSGWFVKFRVDLEPLLGSLPELISKDGGGTYRLLDIVQKDDEGSFLVLGIPGKAVRLNLWNKSFEKLCDFVPYRGFSDFVCGWSESVHFIESLYPL